MIINCSRCCMHVITLCMNEYVSQAILYLTHTHTHTGINKNYICRARQLNLYIHTLYFILIFCNICIAYFWLLDYPFVIFKGQGLKHNPDYKFKTMTIFLCRKQIFICSSMDILEHNISEFRYCFSRYMLDLYSHVQMF